MSLYQLKTGPNQKRMKVKHVNKSSQGERIEQKVERIVTNNEPISDEAPLIYTERKDGVQAEYDIRADKWDIAIDGMDKVEQANRVKREISVGERHYEKMTAEQKEAFNTKYPHNIHNQKAGGGESEA